MTFIEQHAAHTSDGRRWGVESICTMLTELGASIAPSTYYDARRARAEPSPAVRRDQLLAGEVARVHNENYGVYGARKVWAQLNREGFEVARCTVERLMRAQGLAGVRRGRRVRTTIPSDGPRAQDLVGREFNPPAPDRLWVADFTYVATWSGMVYVAFVLDAYSRRILGWRAATTMRTSLVLDALEQAVWTRAQQGVDELDELVHHSDAGSQRGLKRSMQHLDRGGGQWDELRGGRPRRPAGRRCTRQGGHRSAVTLNGCSGAGSPRD